MNFRATKFPRWTSNFSGSGHGVATALHAGPKGPVEGLDLHLVLCLSLLLRLRLLPPRLAVAHQAQCAANRRADACAFSGIAGNRAADCAQSGPTG